MLQWILKYTYNKVLYPYNTFLAVEMSHPSLGGCSLSCQWTTSTSLAKMYLAQEGNPRLCDRSAVPVCRFGMPAGGAGLPGRPGRGGRPETPAKLLVEEPDD